MKDSVTRPSRTVPFGPISDTRRMDLIAALGVNAPHLGMDGIWYVTAHSNRECWGKAPTLRECVDQVITATGPEFPDDSLIRALPPVAAKQEKEGAA